MTGRLSGRQVSSDLQAGEVSHFIKVEKSDVKKN